MTFTEEEGAKLKNAVLHHIATLDILIFQNRARL